MAKTNTTDNPVLNILEIELSNVQFHVVGISPFVPHAMSFKAQSSILFPSPKKNAAEKAVTMKHEPFEEFRDAAYKFQDDDDQQTRMYIPGRMFHAAMANAAIDMVGAKKSQIGRLTNVVEEKIPVWGIPNIWQTIVKSSDMARTPDIRSLPLLKRWACTFSVEYVGSLIKLQSISNLLGAAGRINGIGDGRPEKGKLSMGKFRVCSADDPEYLAVIKHGHRKAQDAAFANPVAYDEETRKLLEWFVEEKKQRVAAPPRVSKTKNGGQEARQ